MASADEQESDPLDLLDAHGIAPAIDLSSPAHDTDECPGGCGLKECEPGLTDQPVPAVGCMLIPAPAPAPKRPTLFDLEAEYLSILAILDEGGQLDDEPLLDRLAHQLQQVDERIDVKVEGWCRWIASLESDGDAAARAADRLDKRAQSFNGFASRLRAKLKEVLIALDKKQVRTALFTVTVKKSPPSVASVSIPDLPSKFLKPPLPAEPDKRAILEEWKRTKGAQISGVVIKEDGKSLEIR
jgi:hypothetical protein